MEEDIQRVFIHELGHFVAAELAFIHFGYDRRSDELEIYKRVNTDFYNGHIKTYKTVNLPVLDKQAKEYTQLFFGCLFESIYRGIEIIECLCLATKENYLIDNICNGKVDNNFMAEIVMQPGNEKIRYEWFELITNSFWQSIFNKKEVLNPFFNLKVSDFSKEIGHKRYSIDIQQLRAKVLPLLDILAEDYISIIKKLNNLRLS